MCSTCSESLYNTYKSKKKLVFKISVLLQTDLHIIMKLEKNGSFNKKKIINKTNNNLTKNPRRQYCQTYEVSNSKIM